MTEPEPLPAGHTLFGRRNVIVTPHLSGRTVRCVVVIVVKSVFDVVSRYFDLAVDVFVENLKRIGEGREVLNRVDPKRGY